MIKMSIFKDIFKDVLGELYSKVSRKSFDKFINETKNTQSKTISVNPYIRSGMLITYYCLDLTNEKNKYNVIISDILFPSDSELSLFKEAFKYEVNKLCDYLFQHGLSVLCSETQERDKRPYLKIVGDDKKLWLKFSDEVAKEMGYSTRFK